MKKIVIFGNKNIAIECLKILHNYDDVMVSGVIGCETKDDTNLGHQSLKKFCEKNNLSYYNPAKLDAEFFEIFKNMSPDLCFSLLYRNIFSKEYLAISKEGFINIHPSLLPKYRGPVPNMWALLNNEEETGVTMHYIDNGIDTGDIIKQIAYKIPNNITGFELGNNLMDLGIKLFNEQISSILGGKNNRIKQDHSKATYFGQFNPSLKKINWLQSSAKIIRQIQAFTKPFDGAFALRGETKVTFWKAENYDFSKEYLSGPGKILEVFDNKFVVSTIDGFLLISDYSIDDASKNIEIGSRFTIFD